MYIFVCKGNLFRSRMASALFSHLTGIPSESYGTHLYENEEVCPKFVCLIKNRYNLCVGGEVRQISLEKLENATRVYYMSDDNRNCLALYPLSRFDHIQPLKLPEYHSKTQTNCTTKTCIVDPGHKPNITQIEEFCKDIHDAIFERWVLRKW